jgi:hypothetical protein
MRNLALELEQAGITHGKFHRDGRARQSQHGGIGRTVARKSHVQPGGAIIPNFRRNGDTAGIPDTGRLQYRQPRMTPLVLAACSGNSRVHYIYRSGSDIARQGLRDHAHIHFVQAGTAATGHIWIPKPLQGLSARNITPLHAALPVLAFK